ncbi:MAG TPA: hypothetical protein VGL81_04060 [Polyangiaceae bacterium]|jgi:hypothetical protein
MTPTTLRPRSASALLALALLTACGGKQGAASAPATNVPDASGASDGGAAAAQAQAQAQAQAPAPRPFATTSLEAQSLIQEQIDAHMKPLWKCVTDYRTKKGDPHKAVVVDIGIDQEGTLLGVMTANQKKEGDLDPALRECVFGTLHGLPFPRSHAGVITVRQSFTDASVTP